MTTRSINFNNNGKNVSMYEALSHPSDRDVGHEPTPTIYRSAGKPRHGFVRVDTGIFGDIAIDPNTGIANDYLINGDDNEYLTTSEFDIAFTQWGDKGPLVLFLHGVPSNRMEWFPIQRRVGRFCRTVSVDLLGMGESSKPRNYGIDYEGIGRPWDWHNDIDYIEQVMQSLYPDENFVIVGNDWGSGPASHYAARYSDRINAYVQQDPIAFDGYPVWEIQAIGRASAIKDDDEFAKAMGSFDQTLVQIVKTMVHNPDEIYNQYSLRVIMGTYVDVDYERSLYDDGENASSMTLRLKYHAIRVLAERAAILAPHLLFPYDPLKNIPGVKFHHITVPSLIYWGSNDNMMPANQAWRFIYALSKSTVDIDFVPDAGHFAHVDKPDLVSEILLKFLLKVFGKGGLADIFIGFRGIWKGDEYKMIDDLRRIYNIDAQSEITM